MTRQSLQIELAERPHGEIIPGKTFRQTTVTAPTDADLKDGEILVETLYLSLDPAMRGWLDDKRSYVPPVQIGEIMRAAGIVRVLASKSSRVNAGDIVTAYTGLAEVRILSEDAVQDRFPLPPNGRVTDLLGVLGMTGLTAYFGMTKIGQPKAGETVVVTTAAGATGSVAAQIAKIHGARVVGITGSDDKVKWLKEELKLDEALNYKDPDFEAKFKAATPDYIDVFYDNVGGEQLNMALGRAKKFARFIECGMISQYNKTDKQGPKNIFNVIAQSIRMQGFIVFDYLNEYESARKQLAEWIGEGKISRTETIVKGGLKVAEETLLKLFSGHNTGKLLVEVKNPEESPKL